MNGKKSRSNKKQIKVLVDFMSTHNHFATGEFKGPLGAKRSESQWNILKSLLKEHGPDRSVEQWKQTWKDLKKHARSENAAAARALNATGNKDAIPIVSEIGTKILDTIGDECSTGIGPEESPIGYTNEIASSLTERNNLLREHNNLLREQNAHLAEGNRLKRMKRFSRRFSFS